MRILDFLSERVWSLLIKAKLMAQTDVASELVYSYDTTTKWLGGENRPTAASMYGKSKDLWQNQEEHLAVLWGYI